ncbi:hypothetical protein ABHI18_012499, partial [Aspergillus niger]
MAIGTHPKYCDIVQKIRNEVGLNPTAEKYLEAGRRLSREEIHVLVENHEAHYKLSDGQRRELTRQVSQSLVTPEMEKAIDDAVDEALKSAAQVEYIFNFTLTKLLEVERDNNIPGKFTTSFQEVQAEWQKAMRDSKELAASLAVQYEDAQFRFRYCNSEENSVKDRLDVIEKLLKDLEETNKKHDEMIIQFSAVQRNFQTFSSSFDEWAGHAVDEKEKEIRSLREAIEALEKEIERMEKSMYAIAGHAVLTVLGTAICAAIVGPWAPWAMLAGLIVVGAELATIVGLVFAISAKNKEVDEKHSTIKHLEGEIETIKETNEYIKDIYAMQSQLLSVHIGNVINLWSGIKNEALTVKQWLDNAGDPNQKPGLLEDYIDAGNNV